MNLEDAVGLHSLAKVTSVVGQLCFGSETRAVDSKMGGYSD